MSFVTSLLQPYGSSTVHNNDAIAGGGVMAASFSNITVVISRNSSVHSNIAESGGGLQAEGNASVTSTGGSSIHNNTATHAGGGLSVFDNVTVTISGSSSVHSNVANGIGGGVLAPGNVTVVVTANSNVFGNKAVDGLDGGHSGVFKQRAMLVWQPLVIVASTITQPSLGAVAAWLLGTMPMLFSAG
jgi:hypothetical protein